MKKIIKSFTFWGIVIGLLTILQQQMGYDSKSIMLIWFNPILKQVAYNPTLSEFMNSGYNVPVANLIGQDSISIYWYIGSLVTFAIYGGVIDLIRFAIKKHKAAK